MSRRGRIGIEALLLIAVVGPGAAQAADAPGPALHLIPDLPLSISEIPGEVSVRLPLATDMRLGAGMAVPLSERAQLYGEYRFLRGRLDAEVGRGLLQREPDTADFRAGFSIRLD